MVIHGFAVLQILKNLIVVIAFLQLFPVQYFSLSCAGFAVFVTPALLTWKASGLVGCNTVEPRFNKPLYNKVLEMTNYFLQPGQNYCKMYGTEP